MNKKKKKLKILDDEEEDESDSIGNISPISKVDDEEESETDIRASLPDLQQKPYKISKNYKSLKAPYVIVNIKKIGDSVCAAVSQKNKRHEYYTIEDLKKICAGEIIDFLLSRLQFSAKK